MIDCWYECMPPGPRQVGGRRVLGGEVRVVSLRVLLSNVQQLQSAQVEALLLETLDDLCNEATLDAIRLDHDVSLLHGGYCEIECKV